MSNKWAGQRERGSALSLRMLLWIAVHLGRSVARLFLYPITLYFLLKACPQRQASRDFLTRARGRPASLVDVGRHIHCFAATILDRVYLLTGRQNQLEVDLRNPRLVTDRIAAGQGFLLLGSHLGSFEILRALAVEEISIPLKILMHPEHNRIITEMLDALNPRVAATVIPLGQPTTLLSVKEALDSGHAVGLLGDRSADDEPWINCQFFDAEARFPLGSLTLAAVTRVPVILIFGLYRGGNRYEVFFEDFAEHESDVPREDRAHWVEQCVQHYATRLEHYARMAPENWFNFYDFWDQSDGN